MHSTQTLLRAQRGAGEATNREEIKKSISQNGDAVALLAHASHELSLFRRSSIRPSLEQGYSGLCSDKVPVTKVLFGDNLADSMKEVQETSKLCSRISQHAKTTPSHGGKQYHNNKGYYKKSNKNHFFRPELSRPELSSRTGPWGEQQQALRQEEVDQSMRQAGVAGENTDGAPSHPPPGYAFTTRHSRS